MAVILKSDANTVYVRAVEALYTCLLYTSKKMTKYVNTNLLLIDFKNIFMPVFHWISYVGVIKCGVDAVYGLR